MTMQQYCLRWNNHQPNFISVFSNLLNSESLVDVTLSADGRHLQAHKLVLSACSSYFQSLFTMNPCQHPIVILKDVKFTDLKVIIDFMYYGEVNVSQDELPHILKTAEALKIKGLAEIPVEASLKQQNNTSERTELLPAAEPNWTPENQRQSLSPSPCPLSPASKRKRLRKVSTGSGSTEKHASEEHSSIEVAQSSPVAMAVIKPDPGFVCSNPGTPLKCSSKESRHGSYDSSETRSPQQINFHISQDLPAQHSVENTTIDMSGTTAATQTVTERVIITTHAQLSQSSQYTHTNTMLGSKRSRILMRQSRVKKDGDNPDGDSAHYLSVPHLRVERQVSDPFPTSVSPPPGPHLAVPGNVLVKQHSHPLLPSQMTCQSASPPPPFIPPTLQIIPHPSGEEGAATTSTSASSGGTDQPEVTIGPAALRVKSEDLTPTSMKVRTDELKRSVSSPSQTNTRSSHCPVVRPGPALGCNYCWNTVDTHGRILRRKTKYHCPECQTNLCIVPCFQEYHERHVSDSIGVAPSTVRVFPKTTSM